MAKSIEVKGIIECFLQDRYPNEWVVIAYEPSYDEEKQKQYWEVIKSLNLGDLGIQVLIDTGALLIHCEDKAEAYKVFEMFPDPEVKGYACLFGPWTDVSWYSEEGKALWKSQMEDGGIMAENT